jgi:molybdopterin-containing oxidoreductase family molybdopterin binding subunit
MQDPGKWKIPYNIEFNLCCGVNFIGGKYDPNIDAKAFKNVFQVSFELYLNETTYFSDIVLPDACFLESMSVSIDYPARIAPVSDEWSYSLKQRVIQPLFKRRQAAEVILEIAERVGIIKEYYEVLNGYHFREPYKLRPDERYTWEEIIDRRYTSLFGSQHGLEWFKKNGVIKWRRKVEEIYWKPFIGGRTSVYNEYLKRVANQVERVIKDNGLQQLDLSHFQPLPDWRPCRSNKEKRSEYDLFVVWRRDSVVSHRWTHQHPWIDEICKMDPYIYYIAINSDTAKKKGLKNGDWVELTSAATGNSVKGRVQLSEGIHPEVIALSGGGGHWAKGLPIASQPGKGVLFEWLIPVSFDQDVDTVTLSIDWCVKGKLSKISKE